MGDSPQVYCVCRSAEVDRFMIGCDHCEEWFHGDCISANQKEADKLQKEAKYIKKFFCKECREKNPHLSIVYKSKYAEKIKVEEESRLKEKKKEHKEHKKDKHKEKNRERDHEKEKKSKDKKSEKHRSRSRSKSKEKEKRDQTRPYDKHAHKHKNKDREKEKDREREKIKEERKAKDDPPIETIDLRKPRTVSLEEKIKHDPVKEEDDIVILDEPKPKKFKSDEPDKERRIEMSQAKRMEELKRERSLSIEVKSPKASKTDVIRKVLQPKPEHDNVVNLSDSSDEWSPAVSRPVTTVKATVKRKASKDQRDKERASKKRGWVDSSSDDDDVEVDELAPRQCYGMNCVNCARVGSKYCSDQCGTSLATLRIYQTLPDRIREWNQTACKSSETNHRELVRIRTEIDSVKKKLEETDKKVVALEAAIARSRSLDASESHSQDSSDEEDEQRGTQVTCVSCGKDVPSRTAIRHMESCFNKFEAQTSYGSMHPTQIEGYQMVCDFYNPDTRTYCKRLRAICPEHTKDKVVGDRDLCGAPLVKNLFKQTGEICKLLKKDCSAHYCWEKLRRAELDLDRVRQWVKLDELMDQERQEKEHLSRRAGVLNLMLHSTFNHELMEKMMAERQQQMQHQNIKSKQQQQAPVKK